MILESGFRIVIWLRFAIYMLPKFVCFSNFHNLYKILLVKFTIYIAQVAQKFIWTSYYLNQY